MFTRLAMVIAALATLLPAAAGAAEKYTAWGAARIAIYDDCNFKSAREEIAKISDEYQRGATQLAYDRAVERAAATRREYKLAREANSRGNDFYRNSELDKAAEQYRFAEAKFNSLLEKNNPAHPPCERYKRVIGDAVKIVGRNLERAAAGELPPKKLAKRVFNEPRYQGFRISTDGAITAATDFCKITGYARDIRYEREWVQDRAYSMLSRSVKFNWEGQPVEVFKFIECAL